MVQSADLSAKSLAARQSRPPAGLVSLIDRWIYVIMAVLLIVVTLVGFLPDSVMKVGLVETGKRAPFPPVLHLHAIAMGSWFMLLLAQTWLMATGRRAGHMQLGMLAVILAPTLIVIGMLLAPTMYRMLWESVHAMPGGPDDAARLRLHAQANTTLNQMRGGLMFGIIVAAAMAVRKSDPATHKRLMILSPVAPMTAAIARITWLPTTFPANPISLELFVLLVVAPMFLWDLYRLRRIPRAYFIWIVPFVGLTGLVHLLWDAPWWQSIVPRLMGVV